MLWLAEVVRMSLIRILDIFGLILIHACVVVCVCGCEWGAVRLQQQWWVHSLKFEFRLDLRSKAQQRIFLLFFFFLPPHPIHPLLHCFSPSTYPITPASTLMLSHSSLLSSPCLLAPTRSYDCERRGKIGLLLLTLHEDVSRIALAFTPSYHHTLIFTYTHTHRCC